MYMYASLAKYMLEGEFLICLNQEDKEQMSVKFCLQFVWLYTTMSTIICILNFVQF